MIEYTYKYESITWLSDYPLCHLNAFVISLCLRRSWLIPR